MIGDKAVTQFMCMIDHAMDDPVKLAPVLKSDDFQIKLGDFVYSESCDDINFAIWWEYISMVSILLCFTLSLRPKSHLLYGEDTAAVRPLN